MPAVELHIMLFLIVIEPLIIFYITQKRKLSFFPTRGKFHSIKWIKTYAFPSSIFMYIFSYIHQNFVLVISQSSKRRMLITRNLLSWCMTYRLRAFRRETLLWIIILNKVSTPLSRSTMSNSNSCNCSTSYTALLFWNALETRDHLL